MALDTFPMGIVAGVQVVKTNEPDMDAESLGGTVDLVPRTGAEHRGHSFLDLDLGGGYESLRGTPVIHAAATAGGSLNAHGGTLSAVLTYSNGPAHVYGAEVQIQQQFLSLPAPLDGLGFDTNVTVVHSEAQIHPGIRGPLPSTAELTSNLALFYQREPIEVRVAADYVGQDLFGFGPELTNAYDVYSSPRLTLDLGSSYSVSRSVQVYLDAKNLLNTPLKFTEGTSESRPIQREFYDLTLLVGIRASLD